LSSFCLFISTCLKISKSMLYVLYNSQLCRAYFYTTVPVPNLFHKFLPHKELSFRPIISSRKHAWRILLLYFP
jgi:hypothetical protein